MGVTAENLAREFGVVQLMHHPELIDGLSFFKIRLVFGISAFRSEPAAVEIVGILFMERCSLGNGKCSHQERQH